MSMTELGAASSICAAIVAGTWDGSSHTRAMESTSALLFWHKECKRLLFFPKSGVSKTRPTMTLLVFEKLITVHHLL